MSKEMVNHPTHYNANGRKECWDEMIDIFGIDAVVTFDVANAYKYYYRAGLKDDNPAEQDLRKIGRYMAHAESLLSYCSAQTQTHYLTMKDLLGVCNA